MQPNNSFNLDALKSMPPAEIIALGRALQLITDPGIARYLNLSGAPTGITTAPAAAPTDTTTTAPTAARTTTAAPTDTTTTAPTAAPTTAPTTARTTTAAPTDTTAPTGTTGFLGTNTLGAGGYTNRNAAASTSATGGRGGATTSNSNNSLGGGSYSRGGGNTGRGGGRNTGRGGGGNISRGGGGNIGRGGGGNTGRGGGNNGERRQIRADQLDTCHDHEYVSSCNPDTLHPVISDGVLLSGAQVYNNPEITDTVRKMVITDGKIDVEFFNSVYCDSIPFNHMGDFITSQKANKQLTVESFDGSFNTTTAGGNETWRSFLENTEVLRVLGKYCKDTIKALLSGNKLKSVDALHTDFGKQITMTDFLDFMPAFFDSLIMESKSLADGDYYHTVLTVARWLGDAKPTFNEITLFFEDLPIVESIREFLTAFPHTAFKGLIFVICKHPITNCLAKAITEEMNMEYLGTGLFDRLPQAHLFHLFIKKEEGCKNVILGFKECN